VIEYMKVLGVAFMAVHVHSKTTGGCCGIRNMHYDTKISGYRRT
jgi:hypothetical protein